MKFFAIILFVLIHLSAYNQSMRGVTGVPDTSYTTYSAYVHTKKDHPDISIVQEVHSPAVTEEKGIVYSGKLVLDAFYPTDKKKDIAIMIIHGGGWRSGNRTQHYPLAQRLAGLGYTCYTPEYRLSTEALYPAAVNDLKEALKWIKQQGFKKITVAGFSAGGELAAFLGTTDSIVDAVVDIDGTLSFVHPETGEGDDSKSISAGTYWFGYSKKENFALWTEASPLTHAGKSTPPTLFLNSAVERMHAGRTDYIAILNKYKTYSEVHTFEGAPHSFPLFNPWFDPMVKYIDDFLKKVFP